MGEIEIRREAYGIDLIGWEPDSNAIRAEISLTLINPTVTLKLIQRFSLYLSHIFVKKFCIIVFKLNNVIWHYVTHAQFYEGHSVSG